MFRFLVSIFLFFVAANCLSAAEIGDVRCEYRVNPLGIDNPNPRLNWIILSPQRGELQTAYQVLVASSEKLLSANTGDLWDSGQVPSDQSAGIRYDGKPLSSGLFCFWKVRVWDRNGKPSHWSRPASWTMGLLHPSDWTAQWISDPLLAAPANRPLTPIHCYRSELTSRSDAIKWIVLDLATNQPMDAINLIPARTEKENWDFRTPMFPLRFKVEVANNPDFSNAKIVVDETRADCPNPRYATCPFSFAPTTARYVRLTVTRLSCWDAQEYGLALGGFEVFDGKRSLAIGAHVECSDSIESTNWSKQFLVDGQAAVALAPDAPVLAADLPGVPVKSTASRVPMLRRDFNVTGKIKRATLYVSARGFYEVHLNGKKVGDELLPPGFTDYDARLQYQTYDVARLLHRGPNALGALLGYGWYAGHMNLWNLRSIYGYFPQFLAQLEIELADGTTITINSDDQWRSILDGPIRWSDLLDGEGYDCRREMPGWDKPAFDARNWSPVWTQPRNAVPLVSQFSQPVREISELKPISLREVKPGVYVYDFGQEITGWCRLKANGSAGTHLRLRHSEMVAPDGALDMKNLWGVPQQEDYLLDGHGPRVFEPHFTYHGFRYVELTGLPGGGLPADTLTAVNLRSDLPIAGQFECSNPLFNRIQKAAFWTQANLLFDVPCGCAARGERLAWTGDIRPCVQSLLFNFDAAAFLAKYTRDLRDDQSPAGQFTDICPQAHLAPMGSPGWADAGVSLPWDLYVNTGDQTILAEHFNAARRWVDFVHRNNPDLIWRNNRGKDWGDWLSAGPATPKELGATAFFAHSTDLVARMARALGRPGNAQYYGGLFQDIRRAFVKNYFNTNGMIRGAGDVQGSYALALQFGLLDEPLKSLAAARLTQLIRQNKYHPTTGFWSSVELLLALSANGYNDVAARMMNQDTMPSWGYMADLNPDEPSPGYQTFTLYPRPTAEVSWCRATYNSLHGQIVSNWRCDNKTFNLEVTIPANTTATVIVPATGPDAVKESGKPASEAKGVNLVSSAAGTVTYHVGSGDYHFTSQILPTKRKPSRLEL
jgi:alpha-L-rhamnosidase